MVYLYAPCLTPIPHDPLPIPISSVHLFGYFLELAIRNATNNDDLDIDETAILTKNILIYNHAFEGTAKNAQHQDELAEPSGTISPVSVDSIPDPSAAMTTANSINVDLTDITSAVYNTDELSPTSDSYTVPGSTMKETHIFTPIKPMTERKSGTPTSGLAANSAIDKSDDAFPTNSIVINESVVRKEYHDIDYDSSKLSTIADEFAEFQSMPATIANDILPNKYPANAFASAALNCDASSNHHSHHIIDSHFLSEFDTFAVPAKPTLTNEPFKSSPAPVNNNLQSAHFEIFDTFEKPLPINGNATAEPNDPLHDPADVFSISHAPSQMFSITASDVQSATVDYKPSNLQVDNMGILLPKTINNGPAAMSAAVAPRIEWPEPGLDTQQLQQLENRLPTTNATLPNTSNALPARHRKDSERNHNAGDDDEWSDFVSVAQPQTPITNILNQSLLKQQNNANDEDDWSEFVSSTTPNATAASTGGFIQTGQFLQQQQIHLQCQPQQHHSHHHHQRPSPVHASHDMSQIFNNNHSNAMHSNMKFNVPHNHHDHRQHQSTISSSIISLPDLRFVAPKSLVNMPTRSLTKK